MKALIFFSTLIINSFGIASYDDELERICNKFDGKFKKREENSQGDVCVAKLSIATNDDEEALQMCKMWFPYHVKSAKKIKDQTECRIHSYIVCGRDQRQIHGSCYKLVRNTRKLGPFRSCTRNRKSSYDYMIPAKFSGYYMSRMIRMLFPRVNKIAVEVNADLRDIVRGGDGPKTMLVYGAVALMYGVRGMSFVKAEERDPEYVLCEKKVAAHQLFGIIPFLDLYSEVYYPVEFVGPSLVFRSSNFYGGVKSVNIELDDKRCGSIMKVLGLRYVYKESIGDFQFNHFTNRLNKASLLSHFKVIRTHGKSGCWDINEQEDVFRYYLKQFGGSAVTQLPLIGSTKCFDNRATVIDHENSRILVTTYASFLPMWCGTRFETSAKVGCTDGYKLYTRKSGKNVCFAVRSDVSSFSESQRKCIDEGGYLGGFETDEEFEFIKTLGTQFYMGAKRRKQCNQHYDGKGYDSGDGPCSRKFVMRWMYSVADNKNPIMHTKFANSPYMEPTFQDMTEHCLEYGKWRPGVLNDYNCNLPLERLCQRPAVYFVGT